MDRLEIKNLNLYGSYTHKAAAATNDRCNFCKQQLTAPSLTNLQKGDLTVVISVGKCGHTFHESCIKAYQSKGNISCPLDNTPWSTSKEFTFRNGIKNENDKSEIDHKDDLKQDVKKEVGKNVDKGQKVGAIKQPKKSVPEGMKSGVSHPIAAGISSAVPASLFGSVAAISSHPVAGTAAPLFGLGSAMPSHPVAAAPAQSFGSVSAMPSFGGFSSSVPVASLFGGPFSAGSVSSVQYSE